jgi:hypothetical protein
MINEKLRKTINEFINDQLIGLIISLIGDNNLAF